LAIWGKSTTVLSRLEKWIVSFGLSIILVDFMMLFFGRIKLPLTKASLLAGLVIFYVICYSIYKVRFKNEKNEPENKKYIFSKNQVVAIILILFLTVFLRAIYLNNAVLPSATDLGHHMYWAKEISMAGQIPNYTSRDIVQVNGNYEVSAPKNISDVIIGEHLIFSAINLITGIDFISFFPVITLLLIDLMSLLALFILAFRLFSDLEIGKKVAIFSLFFIGPIFAISPPQAKFVDGGVIGNVMGDLLLPLTFIFTSAF
jgi:hypothetical protein